MGSKLKHEEFMERYIIGKQDKYFNILGKYDGFRNPIEVQCIMCGRIYTTPAKYIIQGIKCCVNCLPQIRTQSYDDFIEKFNNTKNSKTITVLGDFNGNSKRILVKCNVCNHEWSPLSYNLLYDHGCPVCNGKCVKKGFNDMWTTNPDLAALLLNKNDGYIYTERSNQKLNWQCKNCGFIIRDKTINAIRTYGLSCSVCSDHSSYNNKFIANLFLEMKTNFEFEKTFYWSKQKRYDFYLPEHNCIVEIHGLQHYEEKLIRLNGKTLIEEQKNDLLKYDLAIQNGISHYIVLDGRFSNLKHIKSSILKSKLVEFYDFSYINWEYLDSKSLNSKILTACNLWNSGIHDLNMIGNYISVGYQSVRNYLNCGRKNGFCTYNPDLRKNKKPVKCLSDGEWYESITCAANKYNINPEDIVKCCNGKQECINIIDHNGNKKTISFEYYNKEAS